MRLLCHSRKELRHSKIVSAVRYLGIEVDVADADRHLTRYL